MSTAPAPPARWPGVAAAALRLLPLRVGVRAGARFGDVVAPWLGRRRAVAHAHLALAFPDASEAEREAIWRESLRHQGRSLVELAWLAGSPEQRARLVGSVEIAGRAHADRARACAPEGRGVVVVTAHTGNWELCLAAMAAEGYPMTVVHHGLGRPGLSAWLGDVRTRQGDVELVELGRARAGEMLTTTRAGRHLVAMMDQNARLDEGSFAPFFGAPACTRRGPVVMAMRLGVPLLPAFSYRVDASPTHRVEFLPPIRVDTDDAPPGRSRDDRVDAVLAEVNRVIEAAIRARPAQWIWSHRRYKTRLADPSRSRGAPQPSYASRRRRARG